VRLARWPRPSTRAAVVGRFLSGSVDDHVVLSFATALCDHAPALTVVVATSPADPTAFEARQRALAELVPAADIVEAPMVRARPTDEGSPRAWEGSAAPDPLGPAGVPGAAMPAGVLQYLRQGADALVGRGLDHLRLASRIGLDYIPVDVPPGTPPATATHRPSLVDWQALTAEARARHARPVVIMGPESTGKTTLARDLARHFATAWSGEYLRVWLDAKGAVCEPADLPYVVAGHRASEAALTRHATGVLFCDTDPLMTAVYSRFYYGHLPDWLDEAASARRAAMYLLLDCDVPWVPDPQRDMPHRRDEIRDLCREELERRRLPWTLIRGAWPERVDAARDVVEGLLTGPGRTG
jgi:nicotinamide riboside kinase